MSTNASNAPLAVHAAIVQVMDEVGREGVGKGHTADFGGQKRAYRGIDDIYNALNRAMVRARLAIIPSVVEKNVERFPGAPNQYGKVTTTHVYSMVIDYKVICAIDSSSEIMRIFIEGFDTSDKGTGKAFSYAYKCGVLQLFCIPVEGQEDQDAHDPRIERDADRGKRPSDGATAASYVARPETAAALVSAAERQRSAPERPDTRPARKVGVDVPAKPELKHPAGETAPFIVLKKHARYGEGDTPISVLSDAELCDYVRQLSHIRDSAAEKEKASPGDGRATQFHLAAIDFTNQAVSWAQAVRGITDFSKRQQDRSEQLKAAVAGDEYNPELYLCVHPKWKGEHIHGLNAEVLSDYLAWLDAWVNPTQTARKLLVEKRITKLAEEEAARIEDQMAAASGANRDGSAATSGV